MDFKEITRFKDAPFINELLMSPVSIVGAGGIGSWLTLILSKMNVGSIDVYDFDQVENHNIGGQLYGPNSVGRLKVNQLQKICERLSSKFVYSHNEEVDEGSNIQMPIVFMALDNMEARRNIFDIWHGYINNKKLLESRSEIQKEFFIDKMKSAESLTDEEYEKFAENIQEREIKPLLIDVRMSAEVIQIVTVNQENADEYMEYWFPDEDVEDGPCRFKATTYTGSMAASLAAMSFVNSLTPAREVPIYKEYNLPFNLEL